MIQKESLVCNEYVHLYFNSSFEKGIISMMFCFNTEIFLKSFNMSKCIHTSQIFMIYLKLGDTTDIA